MTPEIAVEALVCLDPRIFVRVCAQDEGFMLSVFPSLLRCCNHPSSEALVLKTLSASLPVSGISSPRGASFHLQPALTSLSDDLLKCAASFRIRHIQPSRQRPHGEAGSICCSPFALMGQHGCNRRCRHERNSCFGRPIRSDHVWLRQGMGVLRLASSVPACLFCHFA